MNTILNNDVKTLEQFKDAVGCKGNIKKTTKGNDMVGLVFKLRKGFPKLSECEEKSQYVRVGESVKVVAYNDETKEYTLVNLNMNIGSDMYYSWFNVDDTELDYLLRRGSTK